MPPAARIAHSAFDRVDRACHEQHDAQLRARGMAGLGNRRRLRQSARRQEERNREDCCDAAANRHKRGERPRTEEIESYTQRRRGASRCKHETEVALADRIGAAVRGNERRGQNSNDAVLECRVSKPVLDNSQNSQSECGEEQ